jgi:gliding motility-associated-like protein
VFPNEEPGTYVVELIAISPLGCADTTTRAIVVQEELIFYIPNTFTPDGDDFNEYFQAIFTSGYDPYDFNLYIFNRWGEIIWESHDASIGWDGTYGVDRSELVQDGTYTWKIDFKTTMSDERIEVVGHVNVVK